MNAVFWPSRLRHQLAALKSRSPEATTRSSGPPPRWRSALRKMRRARARRIFLNAERQRGGGPELRVVASGDRDFSAANWWRNREGQKTAFMEWTKTLTSLFGI